MDSLVRRALSVLVIGISLLVMSCSSESKEMKDDIEDTAKIAMQRFVD